MPKLIIVLSDELKRKLLSICGKYGLSQSEIVRRGLVEEIKKLSLEKS